MSTVVLCDWDEFICPICAEEMDGSDISMFPCPCEYQICLWCLKRIRDDSAKCPLCRRPYDDQSMTKVTPPKRLIRKPKPQLESLSLKPDQLAPNDNPELRNDSLPIKQPTLSKNHLPPECPTLKAAPPSPDPGPVVAHSSAKTVSSERAPSGPALPCKKGWLTNALGPTHAAEARSGDAGDDAIFPSLAATVPKVEAVKIADGPPTAPAPRVSESHPSKNHQAHTRKTENPFQTICANLQKLKLVMLPPPPPQDNESLPPEPAPPCKVEPPPAPPASEPPSAPPCAEPEIPPPLRLPLPQNIPPVYTEDLAPPPGFDQLGANAHLPPPPGITAPPLQVYARPPSLENSFGRPSYEHIYNPPAAFGYAGARTGGSVEYYKPPVYQSMTNRYDRVPNRPILDPSELARQPLGTSTAPQAVPRRPDVPIYPPPFRPPVASAKDVLNDDGDLFGWDAYDDAGAQWLDSLLNMHLGQNRYNGQLMQQSSFVSSTDFEWQRQESNATEQIVNRLLGAQTIPSQGNQYMQPNVLSRHLQQQQQHAYQHPDGWPNMNHNGATNHANNSINQMSSNLVPGLTGGGCIEHVNGQLSIDILRSVIPNAKISILEPCQRSR